MKRNTITKQMCVAVYELLTALLALELALPDENSETHVFDADMGLSSIVIDYCFLSNRNRLN